MQYQDIIQSLDSTLSNIEELTERLNSPNSSLGLLLNDKSLYNNVNTTIKSANNLIIDLQSDPRKYLYPLGRKQKKK